MTMTTAAAAEVENSEYALRGGELTKEMFAAKADTSTKTVENWIKAGKIDGEYRRRSVDGKPVRKTLIIMEPELEKVNETVKTASLVKPETRAEEINIFLAGSINKMADVMERFGDNGTKQLSGAHIDRASIFLTIDEASDEYGLGVAEIHRLIDSKELRKFSGKNGKSLVSRKQIEDL